MRKISVGVVSLLLVTLLFPALTAFAEAADGSQVVSERASEQSNGSGTSGFGSLKPVVMSILQILLGMNADNQNDKGNQNDNGNQNGDKPEKPGKPDDKPGKPDQAEKQRIINETKRKLVALKNEYQPKLLSIGLQFISATTTQEKTHLYQQGTTVFAECASQFKDIMLEATKKLIAAGFSPSELDPFQGQYTREVEQGKKVLRAANKS